MMLVTYKEAKRKYGSQYNVAAAVRHGTLFRIDRGLYASCPVANHFQIIAKKYPGAIITADTAHYIHGLTDVIPDKTYLATLRNATRITAPDIVQVFADVSHFEPGRTELVYNKAVINIYNKERVLVELLRNSKSMPFDYYKELITSYRRIVDSLDFQKIEDYMGMYKRNEFLLDALQREVL
jgi:predicted transcriptional regulator of viral defense system